MNDPMKNPRFWRDRAEETRTKAEGFRLAESDKQRLLRVAAEYERLADRAEQWRTTSEAELRG
jgi:hypothetical protein